MRFQKAIDDSPRKRHHRQLSRNLSRLGDAVEGSARVVAT